MLVMVGMDRPHRVFVTGLGVISPLGSEASANLRSLVEGKDSVTLVGSFDVTETRCQTAGQIPDEWLKEALPAGRVAHRIAPRCENGGSGVARGL